MKDRRITTLAKLLLVLLVAAGVALAICWKLCVWPFGCCDKSACSEPACEAPAPAAGQPTPAEAAK